MRYLQQPKEVGDPRGNGTILCEICGAKVRDHRIGPCPFWNRASSRNGAGDRGRRTR